MARTTNADGESTNDLRCRRCDTTATYADAQIADINKTCARTRMVEAPGGFRETRVPAKHDWVEADGGSD